MLNYHLPPQAELVLTAGVSRFSAKALLNDLQRDYGPDGKGMNFGMALMPVCVEAAKQLPSNIELTLGQFRSILQQISTMNFAGKAMKDKPGAIQDLIQIVKTEAAKP